MPSPEHSELQEGDELHGYLDDLIAATRKGSLQWASANPTTFLWDTGPVLKGARISLQRVDRTVMTTGVGGVRRFKKVPSYILQAFETSLGNSTLRVSIDSSEYSKLSPKLETLYELVKSTVSRKGLDFLKEILPH